MVKIISVVNQKGGVGKTTTAINIATIFATMGYKVLIIDFDPQSNASSGFGIELAKKEKHSIYQVLLKNIKIEESILNTLVPNLDIIPCSVNLAGAEIDLADMKDREFFLKNTLISIANNYDFIMIDCPPSLSLLTINALVASATILIPLQCEFFALEGLSHLLDTAERIKENFNSYLKINGIVLTMYDKRNKLTEQVENDVRGCLNEMVYSTVIPRNIKLSESSSHGVPTVLYEPNCTGSLAYINLAKEVIQRLL